MILVNSSSPQRQKSGYSLIGRVTGLWCRLHWFNPNYPAEKQFLDIVKKEKERCGGISVDALDLKSNWESTSQ